MTPRPIVAGTATDQTHNPTQAQDSTVDINQAFPSKYISANDIDDEDLRLTISDIKMERVGLGPDAKDKPILYFDEAEKGLPLNVTNKNTLVQLYGTDTDDWVGKRVALFATQVDFQGKPVAAVRIRLRPPKAKAKPQPAPVAAEGDDDDDSEDIPF